MIIALKIYMSVFLASVFAVVVGTFMMERCDKRWALEMSEKLVDVALSILNWMAVGSIIFIVLATITLLWIF